MYEFMVINDTKKHLASSDYSRTKSILEYGLYVNIPSEVKVEFDGNSEKSIDSYVDTMLEMVMDICEEYRPGFEYMGGSGDIEFDTAAFIESIKNHCMVSTLYTCKALYTENSYDNNLTVVDVAENCRNMGFFSLVKCGNFQKDRKVKRDKKIKRDFKLSYLDEGYFDYEFSKDEDDEKNRIKIFRTYASLYRNKAEYKKLFSYKILSDNRKAWRRDDNINSTCFNSDMFFELIEHGHGAVDNAIEKIKEEYKDGKDVDLNTIRKINIDKVVAEMYRKMGESKACQKGYINEKKVDDILFNYQIERYYNHELLDCISLELLDEELEKYYKRYPVMIEILSMAQLLPNAMSRKYFVKKGLQILKNETFLMKNEWEAPKIENFIGFGKVDELDIKIMRWLEFFKKYCIFCSYIAFPIIEKTFFILLYENLFTEDSQEVDVIKKMIDILTSYISRHNEFVEFDFCNRSINLQRIQGELVVRQFEKQIYKVRSDKECDKGRPTMESDKYKKIYSELAYHTYSRDDFHKIYSKIFTKDYFSFIKDSAKKSFRKNYIKSKRMELVDKVSKEDFS